MKIFTLAAAALVLACGATAVTSCGNGEKDNKNDSVKNVAGAQMGQAFESKSNIRYVDLDTIHAHFKFWIEQDAKIEEIQRNLQQRQNQLERSLQQKGTAIQQKLQSNGYLSEASYKADEAEFNKAQQAASIQMNQLLQSAQESSAQFSKQVMDAIEEYIVKYNEEKKYDAILYRHSGLYFNPALDITKEVLEGLNAKYPAKSGSQEEKKEESKKEAAK